jgi:putative flippase GtrA
MRPAWVGELARFGLVALVIYGVDAGVLSVAMAGGLGPLPGRALSLACSVAVGYRLNRGFTFRAKGAASLAEFGRYLGTAGLGILANYGAFAAAVRAGIPPWAAVMVGMGVAAVVTFLRFRAIFRT